MKFDCGLRLLLAPQSTQAGAADYIVSFVLEWHEVGSSGSGPEATSMTQPQQTEFVIKIELCLIHLYARHHAMRWW